MASTFYASGSQGWRPNARADGNGGLLARGWYARNGSDLVGPFGSRRRAEATRIDRAEMIDADRWEQRHPSIYR